VIETMALAMMNFIYGGVSEGLQHESFL